MDLGELEVKRNSLRPAAELSEYPQFVLWAQGIREELQALKEIPWALGSEPMREHIKILESCGLRFPKDSRELYECFLAVKTVVHYTEKRLRELELDAKRFRGLTLKLKRIAEEERETVDGH